jgi:predicted Zn-dependent protease
VTRGSTFLHPPLRFRIDFPQKWEVANSPQQVVAKAPDADVFMLLQGVTKPQGQTVRDVAIAHMQAAGFRAVSGTVRRSTGSTRSSVSTRARSRGSARSRAARRTSRTAARTTWLPASSRLPASTMSTAPLRPRSDRFDR